MKSIHTWPKPLDSEHVSRLHDTLDLLTYLLMNYKINLTFQKEQHTQQEYQYLKDKVFLMNGNTKTLRLLNGLSSRLS